MGRALAAALALALALALAALPPASGSHLGIGEEIPQERLVAVPAPAPEAALAPALAPELPPLALPPLDELLVVALPAEAPMLAPAAEAPSAVLSGPLGAAKSGGGLGSNAGSMGLGAGGSDAGLGGSTGGASGYGDAGLGTDGSGAALGAGGSSSGMGTGSDAGLGGGGGGTPVALGGTEVDLTGTLFNGNAAAFASAVLASGGPAVLASLERWLRGTQAGVASRWCLQLRPAEPCAHDCTPRCARTRLHPRSLQAPAAPASRSRACWSCQTPRFPPLGRRWRAPSRAPTPWPKPRPR